MKEYQNTKTFLLNSSEETFGIKRIKNTVP